MANPRPPKQDNLSTELAAVKTGSTTQILKQLFRIAFQVKEITPDFNTMIRMEAQAASMRNKFERDSSRLMEANMGIQANLSLLNQPRSAKADMVPGFMQIHAPLQHDVKRLDEDRRTLSKEFREFLQVLRTSLTDVITDMMNGKSKQEIRGKLESLEKRVNDLNARADKLEINEESLQRKLDDLQTKTYREVPLSQRSVAQAPGAAPAVAAPKEPGPYTPE
jgi:chromosome segregation ATPase